MSTKTYESCPKKHKARQETIMLPYRKHFGHSLPKEKQYITLCATHYNENNQLLEGSELDQLLKDKLITIDQFIGVDRDKEIIEKNREAIPDAVWHFGDLYRVLIDLENKNQLNPGIVNCDLLHLPEVGSEYVSKVLAFLSYYEDLMVVINLILKSRGRRYSKDDMMQCLYKNDMFKLALQSGWKLHDNACYGYHGTGKDFTDMGSIVLYKS